MESNIGLFIVYTFTILLMIGVPLALTFLVVRRFKVSWWVILTGVLTYIVSQVVYYPVLQLVGNLFGNGSLPLPSTEWIPLMNAVIMGFLAALFEETSRYFGFLFIQKKTKRIESAVGLGIGHGGMESIGFAVWPFFPLYAGALVNFIYVLFYNPGAQLAKGISMDQVQYTVSQISQFWLNPWHLGLLSGLERLIAISTQIFLAVLIWKAVRSRSFGWFALAFFYHMLVEGISIFLTYSGWSSWSVEGVMSIFMLANIYLVYYFWKEALDKRKEKALLSENAEIADEDIDDYEDDDMDDDEDEDLEVEFLEETNTRDSLKPDAPEDSTQDK